MERKSGLRGVWEGRSGVSRAPWVWYQQFNKLQITMAEKYRSMSHVCSLTFPGGSSGGGIGEKTRNILGGLLWVCLCGFFFFTHLEVACKWDGKVRCSSDIHHTSLGSLPYWRRLLRRKNNFAIWASLVNLFNSICFCKHSTQWYCCPLDHVPHFILSQGGKFAPKREARLLEYGPVLPFPGPSAGLARQMNLVQNYRVLWLAQSVR